MRDWKRWGQAAGIRAARTVAQAAVAAIVLGQVDARMVASTAVLAGILSLLTSVAGLPELEE